MKIKTAELEGRALDWAVAIAVGWEPRICKAGTGRLFGPDMGKIWSPSINWDQGGPLTESYKVALAYYAGIWNAQIMQDGKPISCAADKPLIAICRAIVAALLGDEVNVSDELTQ